MLNMYNDNYNIYVYYILLLFYLLYSASHIPIINYVLRILVITNLIILYY